MKGKGHWQYPWAELIAKHMKDVYGWESTPEELLEMPNHKFWGAYMDALAYYKMSRTIFDISQVPESWKDGQIVRLREKGKITQYVWRTDRWDTIGQIYDELYKMD